MDNQMTINDNKYINRRQKNIYFNNINLQFASEPKRDSLYVCIEMRKGKVTGSPIILPSPSIHLLCITGSDWRKHGTCLLKSFFLVCYDGADKVVTRTWSHPIPWVFYPLVMTYIFFSYVYTLLNQMMHLEIIVMQCRLQSCIREVCRYWWSNLRVKHMRLQCRLGAFLPGSRRWEGHRGSGGGRRGPPRE